MRTRTIWPLCALVAILGLLFVTNSAAKPAVPAKEPMHLPHFPGQDVNDDNTQVIAAKAHPAPGLHRIGRRQQIPAPFGERYAGPASLPGISFEWGAPLLNAAPSLYYDAGHVFISRIRSLLYPKHSFW